MIQKLQTRRRGFTLVEIMIVVAIIVLLATIAVPSILRNRKRAQATKIMDDMRQLEQAVDLYTTEWSLTSGTPLTWLQIRTQLKSTSALAQNHTKSPLNGVSYFDEPYYADGSIGFEYQLYLDLRSSVPAGFFDPYRTILTPRHFSSQADYAQNGIPLQ